MKQLYCFSIVMFYCCLLTQLNAQSSRNFCEITQPIQCGVTEGNNDTNFSVLDTYCGSSNMTGNEVYYAFTPTTTGVHTFELTNLSSNSASDLDMFLVSSCAGFNSCITSSDGTSSSDPDIMTANLTANQTVYLIVDGDDGSIAPFSIDITCTQEFECIPQEIQCGETQSSNSPNANNVTNVLDSYSCGTSNSVNLTGPEKVFSFRAPTTGTYTFDLIGVIPGQDLDMFAIRNCDPTQCFDSSDGQNGNSPDNMSISMTAGQTIQIIVDGDGGSVSPFTIVVGCEKDCESAFELTVEPCGRLEAFATVTDPSWTYSWTITGPGGFVRTLTGQSIQTDLPKRNGAYLVSLVVNGPNCSDDSQQRTIITIPDECICDNVDVTFTPIFLDPPNDEFCCYEVGYENSYDANTFTTIQLQSTAGVNITYAKGLGGFEVSNLLSGSVDLGLPNNATIPVSTGPAAQICFSSPSTNPYTVTSHWLDANEEELCTDEHELTCKIPEENCIQVIDNEVNCEDGIWCFKVVNNTVLPFDITHLLFSNTSGATLPPTVQVSPSPLPHGSTSNTICVPYSGATAPGSFSTKITAFAIDGNGKHLDCCVEETELVVEIPDCTDCCDDRTEFDSLVNLGLTINLLDDCAVAVSTPQFDSCHYIGQSPDWGDGSTGGTTTLPSSTIFTHTYAGSGTYTICLTMFESVINPDGSREEACWSAEICETVEVDCGDCCEDRTKFDSLVQIGLNVEYDSCKVKITAPQFDSCHYVIDHNGPDNDPILVNEYMHMFEYDTLDETYCVLIYESEDGTLENACWSEEVCATLQDTCSKDSCAQFLDISIKEDPNNPLIFQYCFKMRNLSSDVVGTINLFDLNNNFYTKPHVFSPSLNPGDVSAEICIDVINPFFLDPYDLDFSYILHSLEGEECCSGDIPPPPCIPCENNDLITITPTDGEECCYDIDVTIDCVDAYKDIKISTAATSTIVSYTTNLGGDWTDGGLSAGTFLTLVANNPSAQTYPQIATICLDGDPLKVITVEMFDTDDEVICSETLEDECETCEPCKDNDFATIIDTGDAFNCCFELVVDVDCPDTWRSIQIGLSAVIINSQTVTAPWIVTQSSGSLNITHGTDPYLPVGTHSIAEMCYSVGGINPQSVEPISIELRGDDELFCQDEDELACHLCHPCDDDTFATITPEDGDSCCFNIDLEIDCEEMYDSIKIALPTSATNVTHTLNSALLATHTMGNMIIITNPSGGHLPADSIQNALRICYENTNDVTPITIEQFGNNNEVLCAKIEEIECSSPDKPCVQFVDESTQIVCDEDGNYFVHLCIVNGLDPALTATKVIVDIDHPNIHATPKTLFGNWDYCDTICHTFQLFTDGRFTIRPGDFIDISVDIHDEDGECCDEPGKLRIELPECQSGACDVDCERLKEDAESSNSVGCTTIMSMDLVYNNGKYYYKYATLAQRTDPNVFPNGAQLLSYLDCDFNLVEHVTTDGITTIYGNRPANLNITDDVVLRRLWTCGDEVDCSQESELATNYYSYQIYPNPVVNELEIVSTIYELGDEFNGRIYNQFGSLMQTLSSDTKSTLVDVSDLPQGTYIIVLEAENGVLHNYKFLKF